MEQNLGQMWDEKKSQGGTSLTSQNMEISQEYILKFNSLQNPLTISLPQAYFGNEAKRFIQLVHFDIQGYQQSTVNPNIILLPTNIKIKLVNNLGASYNKDGKPSDVFELATLQQYTVSQIGIQYYQMAIYQNRQTDLDKESVKVPLMNNIQLAFYTTAKDGTESLLQFPTTSFGTQINWDQYNLTLRIVDLKI